MQKDLIKNLKSRLLIYSLIFSFLLLLPVGITFAMDLGQARTYFLKGDYEACISESERMLATSQGEGKNLDELYFMLGLSYLKQADYLRSFDVSQILISEFPQSSFREDALMTQAEINFLKEEHQNASAKYKRILEIYPQSRLEPLIYLRMAQLNLKTGDWQKAKQYLGFLERDFPLSFEFRLAKDLIAENEYFTVQVGAFTKKTNAGNLTKKLIAQGYPAFLDATQTQFGRVYRVRVGKFGLRQEAENIENKLKAAGYPTKIYP